MATALSNMATARKAKKPIIHFGVKGQQKLVSILCCFLLHIDLFTHSADMMAQGPSSHLYSHSTHGTLIKRLAPLYRIHSQHKPPRTMHPPILHIGILDSLRNGSSDQINDLYYHGTSSLPGYPGSGPHPPPVSYLTRAALRRS